MAPGLASTAALPQRPSAPPAPEPRAPPAQQRSASGGPSSEMGRLLLLGWTMLADSCADCAVPLMRDPRGDHDELCVGCGRVYRGGGDNDGVADDGSGADGSAGARAETPLQREWPADGAAASATNGPAAPAAAPPAAPQPLRRRQEREPSASDRAADLLSQHMLQGWALLEQTCPICATPLMRERGTRQVRCVACDLPVGPPPPPAAAAGGEAAGGQAPAEEAGRPAQQPAPPAPPAAAAPAAAGPGPAAAAGAARGGPCEPPSGAAAAAPAAAAGPSSTAPASQELQLALAEARAALASKVGELAALVASTPAAQAEQLRSYTGLMRDALSALQQVAALQGPHA